MRTYNSILTIVLSFLLLGCSVSKRQHQGYVSSKSFNFKINFATAKSVIIIPAECNGVKKNFLFDTGAELTLIQRDSIVGIKEKVSGASNRKMIMGNEMIESFKIGNVDFRNTKALNTDLIGLKEKVPDFGGIIGQSIISKGNWLINYSENKIQLSDKNLIDSTFHSIKVKYDDGMPFIILLIEGKKYKALIDLGSSEAFSIPKDSKLAKELLIKYDFQNNEREIYTIGGLQKQEEKIGMIPLIHIGNVKFENIKASIRHTSQLRVGNKFFNNFSVYIDNENRNYSLKSNNL